MSKLYVMVGIPGSGKSYAVKNKLNKDSVYSVFSSDEYRKLICGDENCQTRNQEVFTQLYKDLRKALIDGKDCIFDATNVTRKDRARIFNQIKGIPNVEVIAYVMRTPLEVCIEQDLHRERCVSKEVIKKFLYRYEFPQRFEGFSAIIIDRFDSEMKLSEEQDEIIQTKFFKIIDKMKSWDQENPHHIHNLYDHCFILAEHFPEDTSSWWAGIVHDVGKLFTKFYDDQSIAHYYDHDHVGTYYVLSELLEFLTGSQMFIEHLLFLVNYHMKGHKDIRGIQETKYRQLFGDEWYEDLIEFADADIDASGTESIHDKLQEWIKVDKLTLEEIRSKQEFIDLLKTNSNMKENKEENCINNNTVTKYVSLTSPEVIYYNVIYQVRNRLGTTDSELESALRNIIKGSFEKWELDTKE